jgi:hypothetical protein
MRNLVLEDLNVQLLIGEEGAALTTSPNYWQAFNSVYRSAPAKNASGGDPALAGFANASGCPIVTADSRLHNFLTQQANHGRLNVPLQPLLPRRSQ